MLLHSVSYERWVILSKDCRIAVRTSLDAALELVPLSTMELEIMLCWYLVAEGER